MKSPDDVKKGLEHCINGTSCRGCPYCEECAIASDCNPMHKDLQEYIKQLQDETAEQAERIKQLETERDAAVNFLRSMGCDTCMYDDYDGSEPPCINCTAKRDYWMWRGVQKEE